MATGSDNREFIKQLAIAELQREHERSAIERERERLHSAKWWHKILPFKIKLTIERR